MADPRRWESRRLPETARETILFLLRRMLLPVVNGGLTAVTSMSASELDAAPYSSAAEELLAPLLAAAWLLVSKDRWLMSVII